MNWFSRGYQDLLREIQRKRRRDLFNHLFFWVLLPMLIASCVVFTCRYYREATIQRLESMQLEKLELESRHEELTRSIADLSSRKRIYRYATEKLGMKYPESDDIVLVVDERDAPVTTRSDGGHDVAEGRNGRERAAASLTNVITHFFALYVF